MSHRAARADGSGPELGAAGSASRPRAGSRPEGEPLVRVEGLRVETAAGLPIVEDISFSLQAGEALGSGRRDRVWKDDKRAGDARLQPAGEQGHRRRRTGRRRSDDESRGARPAPSAREGRQLRAAEPGAARSIRRCASATQSSRWSAPTSRTATPRHRSRMRSSASGFQGPRSCSVDFRTSSREGSSSACASRSRSSASHRSSSSTSLQRASMSSPRPAARGAGAPARRAGVSMIYVTHDLAVVAGFADRIAVMYAGRIVEEGPTAEMLQSPQHPYTRGLLNSIPDHAARRRSCQSAASGRPRRTTAGLRLRPGARCASRRATPRCPPSHGRRRPTPPVACAPTTSPLRVVNTACHRAPAPATARSLLSVSNLRAEYRGRGEVVSPRRMSASPSGAASAWPWLASPAAARRRSRGRSPGCTASAPDASSSTTRSCRPRHATARGSSASGSSSSSRIRAMRSTRGNGPRRRRAPGPSAARPLDAEADARSSGCWSLVASSRGSPSATRRSSREANASASDRSRPRGEARGADLRRDHLRARRLRPGRRPQPDYRPRESLGLSLLFITHDLGVVSTIADQVLVLQQGNIVEGGATRDVLMSPKHPYTKALLEAAPSLSKVLAATSRQTRTANRAMAFAFDPFSHEARENPYPAYRHILDDDALPALPQRRAGIRRGRAVRRRRRCPA